MSAEIDGTSKGLLGAFATFTLGSGIAALGYGILLLYRYLGVPYNYGDFNLFMTSILLIAVGGLLLITLLLGVLGALKDVSNLRLVTLVLLFLLFVVLAVVGVYAMVLYKTDRLQKSIDNEINTYKNYKDLKEEAQKKADYLHKHYNCCGSYSEYDASTNYDGIPDSCCLVPGCVPTPENKKYYEKGCAEVYRTTKTLAVFYVAIVALIAAALALLALILYAGLSQRARAGYAVVSRGQLK